MSQWNMSHRSPKKVNVNVSGSRVAKFTTINVYLLSS